MTYLQKENLLNIDKQELLLLHATWFSGNRWYRVVGTAGTPGTSCGNSRARANGPTQLPRVVSAPGRGPTIPAPTSPPGIQAKNSSLTAGQPVN